jgi:hypothetical protein
MQLHLSQRKQMLNNSAKISRPLWLIRSWLRLGTAGMLSLMLVACGGGGGGAAPSGDSSGTGNVAATGSCGIDEAAFTPGNRFEFGYAVYRGGETRTQVISLVNTGGVTFNGTTTVRTSGTTTQGSTVGLETITMPAGTLSVCRVNLDVRTPDGVSQQTQHALANGNCRGQIVRLTDRITGLVATEMSSARFNGASC